MLVSELNFRDIFHKVFIIEKTDFSELSEMFPCDEKANGILVYGYIDHWAGLTFELLSCVSIDKDNTVRFFGGNESIMYKFRNGSVSDCNVIFPADTEDVLSMFSEKIESINTGYQCSEQVQITRDMEFLDNSRNQNYPDDVLVVLYRENYQPEGCWVRCEGVGKNCVFGTLLNEPNQDFGIHIDEIIRFGITKHENSIACIAIFDE